MTLWRRAPLTHPLAAVFDAAVDSLAAAFPQTLPREQPDFNLRLIQPTAVSRRVMDGEPIPDFASPPFPHQRRPPVLSGDGCSGCPSPNGWSSLPGMPVPRSTVTRANSKPERSGVGKVKCRPAFGSTAQKTLAVPQRSYSLSRRASRPGAAGDAGRTSACRVIGFSSRQTTGCLRVIRPFVYLQDVFHLGDVFFIEVGHHPHFFPATV